MKDASRFGFLNPLPPLEQTKSLCDGYPESGVLLAPSLLALL